MMVASHTTCSSDVLCSRMVYIYMVASHTTCSSDDPVSRPVYLVAYLILAQQVDMATPTLLSPPRLNMVIASQS